MKNVVFVNQEGQPETVIQPGFDEMYQEGQQYGQYIARKIDQSIPYSEVLSNYIWENNDWQVKLDKPSVWHKWINGQWQFQEQQCKDFAYSDVKGTLYLFITETQKFPEWKQANFNQRYTELKVKDLSGSISAEEVTELAHIESVIAWKNQLLLERDRVKTALYLAVDYEGVMAAQSSFVFTECPVSL